MNIIAEVTVTGVSEFNKKLRISLKIPSFGSDFDTHCTDYPDGMEKEVNIGQTYTLELTRQSLVKKRGTQETGDGSKPWHYYWGIVGYSDEAPRSMPVESAPRELGNGTLGPPRSDAPVNFDNQAAIKNRSIERQVAFKGVVDIYVALINNGHLAGERILNLWGGISTDTDTAADAIHGTEPLPEIVQMAAQANVNAQEDSAAQEDRETQEALDALGNPPADAVRDIGNLGDFMTKALAEGHGARSAVLKKLGVTLPAEILEKYPSFDHAWKDLVKP